jgi:hypothetical protein
MNYERIYEFRFRDVKPGARTKVWKEIAAFLYEKMGRPERILDPAAGFCEFLNQVPSRERWGVDMNPFVKDHCHDDVQPIVADIFDADLPENYFDAAFMSNFLEHLPSVEKVFELFEKLKAHLKRDGLICIVGPNYKYCPGEYFDCADHLIPLTHVGVEELLYSAGYEIVESKGRFLPFSFRGVLPPSAFLTWAYLHMPLAWPLLGKQFLILARPA